MTIGTGPVGAYSIADTADTRFFIVLSVVQTTGPHVVKGITAKHSTTTTTQPLVHKHLEHSFNRVSFSFSAHVKKTPLKTLRSSLVSSVKLAKSLQKLLHDVLFAFTTSFNGFSLFLHSRINSSGSVKKSTSKTKHITLGLGPVVHRAITKTKSVVQSMSAHVSKATQTTKSVMLHPSASLSKAVHTTLRTVQLFASSIHKATSKMLKATLALVPFFSKSKFVSMFTTLVSTATIHKSVSKTIKDTITSTWAVTKSVAHHTATTLTAVPSVTKLAALYFYDAISSTSFIRNSKQAFVLMFTTLVSAATVQRDISANRHTTITSVPAVQKAITKTVSTVLSMPASIYRLFERTVSAVLGTSATISKAVFNTLHTVLPTIATNVYNLTREKLQQYFVSLYGEYINVVDALVQIFEINFVNLDGTQTLSYEPSAEMQLTVPLSSTKYGEPLVYVPADPLVLTVNLDGPR